MAASDYPYESDLRPLASFDPHAGALRPLDGPGYFDSPSSATAPVPGHALQVRLDDAQGTLVGYMTNYQAPTITQTELTLMVVSDDPVDYDPETAREGIAAPAAHHIRIPIGRMTRTVARTSLIASGMTPEAYKMRLASIGVPPYAASEDDTAKDIVRYTWLTAKVDLKTAHELFDLDEFIPA